MLGRSLVSWTSKKQNSVALSTAEAEYIVADACCTQILYMKQTLLDYGVVLEKVPLLCDNESAVKIANNTVQHSRTKHIDIRHHFLRDHVAKGDIILEGVRSLASGHAMTAVASRAPLALKTTSTRSRRASIRCPTTARSASAQR